MSADLHVAALLAGLAVMPALAQESAPGAAGETAVATFASGCFWCTSWISRRCPGSSRPSRAISAAPIRTPPTRRSRPAGPATRRQCSSATTRKSSATSSSSTFTGTMSTSWTRAASSATAATSTARRSSSTTRPETGGARIKKELEIAGRFDRPVVTQISEAGAFHPAEDYHQDYYKKNPIRYKFYRYNCGRDQRLAELWQGTS